MYSVNCFADSSGVGKVDIHSEVKGTDVLDIIGKAIDGVKEKTLDTRKKITMTIFSEVVIILRLKSKKIVLLTVSVI